MTSWKKDETFTITLGDVTGTSAAQDCGHH